MNYSDSLAANLTLHSLPFPGLGEYEGLILFRAEISWYERFSFKQIILFKNSLLKTQQCFFYTWLRRT